jgi:tetratricopeptide (TPR) repeat protein
MGRRGIRSAHHPFLGLASLLMLIVVFNASGQQTDSASAIYAKTSNSVLLLLVKNENGETIAQGSGFVVESGKIITNKHVASAGRVFIDLGVASLPTAVERLDEFNDLALLTTNVPLSAKPLTITGTVPAVGTNVYAIGNPAGLERTMSSGIVAAVRTLDGRQLIQITAPISPGSSGGPVFNGKGEVIGIAVGMMDKGQNLNFAVPVALAQSLMRGDVAASSNVESLLEEIETLSTKRNQFQYSVDAGSDYQKTDQEIDSVLRDAVERAGNDSNTLLKVSGRAEGQNVDISIDAAERAIRIKQSPESELALGRALKLKAIWPKDPEQSNLLQRSETALKAALRLGKTPSAEVYYHLADVLEDRSSFAESELEFRHALDSSKASNDSGIYQNSLRGLTRVTYSLNRPVDGAKWFNALVATGAATAGDWQSQGERLQRDSEWTKAAESYQQAGLLGGGWGNWCNGGNMYVVVQGEEDNALLLNRKCIEQGMGKKDSDEFLARAHYQIADVLNQRGVYQEGLNQAREAIAIDPANALAYDSQMSALIGLRRFAEAVIAGNQAIRLSDGKYAYMDFGLGKAYFNMENWEFSRQSFEKASELVPTDDAASYNVAVCLERLNRLGEAANWYEEVLRRNPNHKDKQDILKRIQKYRN